MEFKTIEDLKRGIKVLASTIDDKEFDEDISNYYEGWDKEDLEEEIKYFEALIQYEYLSNQLNKYTLEKLKELKNN